MPEVVVAGNIGIDTNVYLPQDFTLASLERREGAFTTNVDGVGQAGGYSSIGYARLERAAGFVGYVGDDRLGRWIDETLSQTGVETRLFIDPAGTSRSINLMRSDGTRNNFYDGKTHMDLRPDLEICRAFLSGARLLHLHLPNWGRYLLPLAKQLGLTVACDLQDVLDPFDPYRSDFIRESDILFCSTVDSSGAESLVHALAEQNARATVVLGRGARGAALWHPRKGFREFPPVASEVPVVDTNGAGDSLAVGFLTAHVLEGRSLEEAIFWGQTAARHACTLRGDASTQLLAPAQLNAALDQAGYVEGYGS